MRGSTGPKRAWADDFAAWLGPGLARGFWLQLVLGAQSVCGSVWLAECYMAVVRSGRSLGVGSWVAHTAGSLQRRRHGHLGCATACIAARIRGSSQRATGYCGKEKSVHEENR